MTLKKSFCQKIFSVIYMLSQRQHNEIIIIESDEDDDILELDSSTISSATNQRSSFYTTNRQSNIKIIPRLLSTSNGFRHKEITGTATAAIFNEKPLNISDLFSTNKQNNVIFFN